MYYVIRAGMTCAKDATCAATRESPWREKRCTCLCSRKRQWCWSQRRIEGTRLRHAVPSVNKSVASSQLEEKGQKPPQLAGWCLNRRALDCDTPENRSA